MWLVGLRVHKRQRLDISKHKQPVVSQNCPTPLLHGVHCCRAAYLPSLSAPRLELSTLSRTSGTNGAQTPGALWQSLQCCRLEITEPGEGGDDFVSIERIQNPMHVHLSAKVGFYPCMHSSLCNSESRDCSSRASDEVNCTAIPYVLRLTS